MVIDLKNLLPGLLLLVLLTSCSALAASPVSLTATTEPPPPTGVEDGPTQTPQPTQVADTPNPERSTPESTQESCLMTAGELQTYEIAWGEETLTGRVYTPPCYYQSGLRYPTLYLLHGATESELQWEELGLDELADDLISRKVIPPLLIVMPREDTWVSVRENPFGDQLIQGVIPWMDKEYRTLPERRFRAVGGISRGGNWAIRLGLLHWGTFGSLGAHSAPLFFGDLNRLPGWLEDIPAGGIPRMYLDISEGDKNLSEAEALRDILQEADVSLEWHLYPGLHTDAYWATHLEEYLLWYSAGWEDL